MQLRLSWFFEPTTSFSRVPVFGCSLQLGWDNVASNLSLTYNNKTVVGVDNDRALATETLVKMNSASYKREGRETIPTVYQ